MKSMNVKDVLKYNPLSQTKSKCLQREIKDKKKKPIKAEKEKAVLYAYIRLDCRYLMVLPLPWLVARSCLCILPITSIIIIITTAQVGRSLQDHTGALNSWSPLT